MDWSRNGTEPAGADIVPAGTGGGSNRGIGSLRHDGVDWLDEHLRGSGGKNCFNGTDQQQTLNLFFSEVGQIQRIYEAENVTHTSFAFSFTQDKIGQALRLDGNTDRLRERMAAGS